VDSSEVTRDAGLENQKEKTKPGKEGSKIKNKGKDPDSEPEDDEQVELKGEEDELELESEKSSEKKGKPKRVSKPAGKARRRPKREKDESPEGEKKPKRKDARKKTVGKLVRVGKVPSKSKGGKDPDAVSIDWETDDGEFESTMNESQLRASEYEAEISHLQRENANLLSEIAHMKPDLDKKTEMLDVYNNKLKEFQNDFERHKLRSLKESRQKMKFASEKLILNLLEVLDNMDRAIDKSKPDDKAESIIKAIAQIRKQMLTILEKDGLKPIDAFEKPFNPRYHEAIIQDKTDDYPDNTVLEEMLKGYSYKDRVIRPTRAKVSQSDVNPAIKIEEPEAEKKDKKEKADKKDKKEKKKDDKEKKKEDKDKFKDEKKKKDKKKEIRKDVKKEGKKEGKQKESKRVDSGKDKSKKVKKK
jgi:molecular chaperone GrpE